MELHLKGKKAIVTGSSSGIGEGIAKCLAKEGAHVMIQGRKKQELERIVQEITASGGVAHYVTGDLAKDEEAKQVAEKTLQTFQRLDILVNNAGIFPPQRMAAKPSSRLAQFIQYQRDFHGTHDSGLSPSNETTWLGKNHPNLKYSWRYPLSRLPRLWSNESRDHQYDPQLSQRTCWHWYNRQHCFPRPNSHNRHKNSL